MQKRITLFIFSFFFTIHSFAQVVIDAKGTKTTIDPSKWEATGNDIYNKNTAGVGIGTAGAPNGNAALEVRSASKGVLIPRVVLTGTTASAPLSAHVAGMMVYNTATAGTAPNDVTPGFYYNDGGKWVRVADASNGDLTKDAWIDDSANAMVKLGAQSNGTSARVAGAEVVIKDNGRVGIGITTPQATLHVKNGDFRLENEGSNWNAYKGVTYSNNQYPQLFLFQARGTKASPTYPLSGTTLGVFRAANAIDSAGGSGFRVRSTENQSATAHGASTIIYTTPNGDSDNTDRFIVDHNGNVGIAPDIRFITARSRLFVAGYARVGTADVTADALTTASDRAGMIRYNSTAKALQFHDDTQWLTAASTATADITNDAWVNDSSVGNTMVTLGTKSDGTTARDAGTEVVIKDDGKVGIGTASPAEKLHVSSNLTANILPLTNFFAPNNTTSGNATMFRLGVSNTARNSGEYRFKYVDNGSTSNSLDFSFNGLTNPLMTIQAGGNVGVGTASPTALVDVQGGGVFRVGGAVTPTYPSAGTGFEIAYDSDGTHIGSNAGTGTSIFQSIDRSVATPVWKDARFRANNITFSTNGVNTLTVLASSTANAVGNVGIGTTTPTEKLQVAGTVAAPNYTATIQAISGTWNLDLGANATWSLAAGTNTLTINNAKPGMFGMLKLVNAGTSSITLPTGSKVINNGGGSVLLTQTASAVDILTFYYDGTNYWWTYGNNYN